MRDLQVISDPENGKERIVTAGFPFPPPPAKITATEKAKQETPHV